MTSPSPLGAPDVLRSPSTPDAVPTWRDLPDQPPYGPVAPPRTPHLGMGFSTVPVEEDAAITPGQIALAVGGTLLLVAIGIGAALLLLGDDETPVADVAPATAPSEDIEDLLSPPPVVEPPPAQGELEPNPSPPRDPMPNGDLEESPDAPSAEQPDGAPGEEGDPTQPPLPPQAPAPLDPAQPEIGEEGSVELPRLFRLRTLPAGTEEDATTVRQTTRDGEVVTEQVTMLTAEAGEIGVRATRADDVAERFEDLVADLAEEDAEELSVRGNPAYLVDGQRLVWLLESSVDTLVEIDAPAGAGTEALLTLAHGLELLR